MAFPEVTVEIAFTSAGKACECKLQHTHHWNRRCSRSLIWSKRGQPGKGGWEAYHKDGNPGNSSYSNCPILCWDCYLLCSRNVTK